MSVEVEYNFNMEPFREILKDNAYDIIVKKSMVGSTINLRGRDWRVRNISQEMQTFGGNSLWADVDLYEVPLYASRRGLIY